MNFFYSYANLFAFCFLYLCIQYLILQSINYWNEIHKLIAFNNPMINNPRISSSKSKAQETSPGTPQDKPFTILNLSELLDHKVLPPSETIMRYRLNSQRSIRNQDQLKFSDSQSNTINSNQRAPLKINYQHYRAKSISEIKNYYDSINTPL